MKVQEGHSFLSGVCSAQLAEWATQTQVYTICSCVCLICRRTISWDVMSFLSVHDAK